MVSDDGQRVARSVIHYPGTFVLGVLRGFCLRGSNGAKGREHERVNADGVVEQGADFLLDCRDFRGRENG